MAISSDLQLTLRIHRQGFKMIVTKNHVGAVRGLRTKRQAQPILHRYLAEFDFRYSNRIALGVNDGDRAGMALLGVKGKRLLYLDSSIM